MSRTDKHAPYWVQVDRLNSAEKEAYHAFRCEHNETHPGDKPCTLPPNGKRNPGVYNFSICQWEPVDHRQITWEAYEAKSDNKRRYWRSRRHNEKVILNAIQRDLDAWEDTSFDGDHRHDINWLD